MNIPPFLEKLLLSNEAVFKNAALGLSGQNMVYVPPGKTAVILEIDIQPFINLYQGSDLVEAVLRQSSENSNAQDFNEEIQQRLTFQLQVINDAYNTNFSFNNAFNISQQYQSTTDTHRFLNYNFTGWKEEVFIYIDRSLYFNILYPYLLDEGSLSTGLIYTYDAANNAFSPKIQNLPPAPVTFNQAANMDFIINIANTVGPDVYFPTNKQVDDTVTGFDSPQTEYFRLAANNFGTAARNNTIMMQQASGSNYMAFWEFMAYPLINVKYALLNKRPSDYGITKPSI